MPRKQSRAVTKVTAFLPHSINLTKLSSNKAVGLSRERLREAFAAEGGRTTHRIGTAIAGRLPELVRRLPPQRKCWMPEDYRMSIFDAVAFGLTFFYLLSYRETTLVGAARLLMPSV